MPQIVPVIQADAPILRLQWRRDWHLPWNNDQGTVEIGRWEHGIGAKCGTLQLASYELPGSTPSIENAGREAGFYQCPLKLGDFVRVIEVLRRVSSNGLQTFVFPTSPVVHWTGKLMGRSTKHMGRQASYLAGPPLEIRRVEWDVGGLAAMLGNVDLGRFWGCANANGAVQVIEGRLVFTPDRIRNRANDALTEYQIGSRIKTQPWDARAVIEAMLMWHLFEPSGGITSPPSLLPRFPRWPEFQVEGLTDALKYEVRDCMATGTLIDPLVALIHPRRGINFQVMPPDPSDSQTGPCRIRVLSALSTPITITIPATEGGGTITIPASDRASSGVVTNVPNRQLTITGQTMPRKLMVSGKGAVVIANLRWSRDGSGNENGQLGRVWPAADDGATLSDSPKYNDHWRSFQIRPSWDGNLTTGTLAKSLSTSGSTTTSDPQFGAGGRNGGRSPAGGGSFTGANVTLLDHIPLPGRAKDASGVIVDIESWLANQTGRTLDYQSPCLRPKVWAHDRSASTWTEIKVSCAVTGPTTIQLGNSFSDALKVKAALSGSTSIDLVVLIALVEPLPFCVSYEPMPPATIDDPPIDADRKRDVTWAEYIWIAQDTTLGLNSANAPIKPTNVVMVRDDTAILQQVLALMRPLGERAATIHIRDRLSLNALPTVGTLITQLDDGDGNYIPVRYMVTAAEADPNPDNFGSSITCQIPDLDLKAVL